jgi:hypothetical protein
MNRPTGMASAILISAALLATSGLAVSAQDGDAKVRVLHASPDAPAVDVYVDGAAVLSEVPFGVISDYLEVPAGEYRIQVFAAGADPSADGAVIDATLAFAAGTATTVAATNEVASIEAQVIADAPEPTAEGAQVRVVHLSADAPAVDVAPGGGEPIVTDLEYPVATGYLTVPAGEYDLEVRPSGSMDVALDLPPLELEAGVSYSAFAIGSLADGSLTVLPAVDAMLDTGM